MAFQKPNMYISNSEENELSCVNVMPKNASVSLLQTIGTG